MKIAFVEVEKWASKSIKSSYSDAIVTTEPIDEDNAKAFEDVEILSIFVYSTLSSNVLKLMPKLCYVTTRSTGYDHIDLDYCRKNNILVSNVPEYGTHTVAEHAFALLLSLTRNLYESINRTKLEGRFSISGLRGSELFNKTIGIIGLGKIGSRMVKIARGFDMKVLAYSRTQDDKISKELGFEYAKLSDLLKESDFISLHLPLTPETRHIINKKNIMNIKDGAFIINTARGGLIETEAIIEGLKNNKLAGVGLDVLEEEVELCEETELLSTSFRKKKDYENIIMDHVLFRHPKVIVTPHNAFNSVESIKRINKTTFLNINSFIDKTPINLVTS